MSEPILPSLSGLSVHDLLRVPHEVLEELRRRGIIRGRNVTGDIGEYLAAAMYKVERAAPGTPGYDVADVARVLEYASSSHLSTTSQRIAGTRPASLARLRAVDLIERFLKGRARSRS